jgi:hypothetical protein
MAKKIVVEPMPAALASNLLIAILLVYAYKVIRLVLWEDKPVEKAVLFFLEDTTVLEKKEPDQPIAEDLSCIIDEQPAFDYSGEELVDVRNVKCAACNDYVYKDGEKCSPYEYNGEGFCKVNKNVKALCPF